MYKKIGCLFIAFSVIAFIISGYVFFFRSSIFNLAGTQWMLVAIILGIYGIHLNLRLGNYPSGNSQS